MAGALEIRWWDGTLVGRLVNRGANLFGYDPAWLERGHELSPLKLPLSATVFPCGAEEDGLPGLLADCLPDAWGRKIAELHFATRKLGPLTPFHLLAWRGSRGVGALQIHPALGDEGVASPKLEAITAAALARGAAEIQRGTAKTVLPQLAQGATAGGAYPKTLVLAYADGSLSVKSPDGIGTPCLLKFDLSPAGGLAACEHAYALMAKAAGIRSVETDLIAGEPAQSRPHLLVRRFDVRLGNPSYRVHFHSLARLLHHQHHRGGPSLDYRDLFRSALRLAVPLSELREIARRMLFNVLAANPDDHGRNHAFQYDEATRTWALTPAFDVTFHSGMLDRGLRVAGEVWPHLSVMETMGREVGITSAEFAELADAVQMAIGAWPKFARRAGVPRELAAEVRAWHRRIRESVITTKVG